MSEPEEKLDLTSLNDALGADGQQSSSSNNNNNNNNNNEKSKAYDVQDNDESVGKEGGEGKTDSALERAEELKRKSNTLGADEKKSNVPDVLAKDSADKGDGSDKSTSKDRDLERLDPTSRQIKAMFPDVDSDTIQAVVTAEGGDFERAINTLLQMSDPTYVPPPPLKESVETRSDAELARALAAEEQEHAQRRQQRQQGTGFFQPSSRGGALGSLFGGGGNAGQRPAESPSYDPTNLSYQPRVRRTTSNQGGQGQQSSIQNARQETPPGDRVPQVWPGPKEAKAWQEDINKMAESGFAKAASTFSALRQRGEQTLQGMQQNRAQAQAGGASASPSGAGGSFFSGWNQRKSSAPSPNIGSGRGFDQDAAPVGDNELAKILARGRNDVSGQYDGTTQPQRKSSAGANAMSDRYKSASASSRRSSALASSKQKPAEDDEEDLGWDDAGRTGGDKPFVPIQINEGTGTTQDEKSTDKSSTSTRNAVSLMEGSTGRGVTPKSPANSGESQPAEGKSKSLDEDNDDGNSDDLEYVANPFEDED